MVVLSLLQSTDENILVVKRFEHVLNPSTSRRIRGTNVPSSKKRRVAVRRHSLLLLPLLYYYYWCLLMLGSLFKQRVVVVDGVKDTTHWSRRRRYHPAILSSLMERTNDGFSNDKGSITTTKIRRNHSIQRRHFNVLHRNEEIDNDNDAHPEEQNINDNDVAADTVDQCSLRTNKYNDKKTIKHPIDIVSSIKRRRRSILDPAERLTIKKDKPYHTYYDDATVAASAPYVTTTTTTVASSSSSSWWPPFPFNLLTTEQRRSNVDHSDTAVVSTATGKNNNNVILLQRYVFEKTKFYVRQMSRLASSASMHLPPAAMPLIALATFPTTRRIAPTMEGAAAAATTRTTIGGIHLFCKRLALVTMGLSITSWAHCELCKYQRLTPLPLTIMGNHPSYVYRRYGSIGDDLLLYDSILPPFLPEEPIPPTPPPSMVATAVVTQEKSDNNNKNTTVITEPPPSPYSWQMAQLRAHSLAQKAKEAPKDLSMSWEEYQYKRKLRHYETLVKKRQSVMEELMAFQKLKKQLLHTSHTGSLKKKAKSKQKKTNKRNGGLLKKEEESESSSPLGWALVTGASRGIGRAFAIELARWDIPVILVGRDSTKLSELTKELRQCYGIPCCAIQIDLTAAKNAAQLLYETTQKEQMDVDVLINNAGISCTGNFVNDSWGTNLQKMLELNVFATTQLCHLYGNDMKQRGRGRIMMVSSITGAGFPCVPGTSLYSATKSFLRTLSYGLSKELEPYGIGVTCCTPGAVKETNFVAAGNMSKDALCWKYPFYAMTPQSVVKRGIRALWRGDTEVVPGLFNRLWIRVCEPLLPPRISMMIGEVSWKPLGEIQFPLPPWKKDNNNLGNGTTTTKKLATPTFTPYSLEDNQHQHQQQRKKTMQRYKSTGYFAPDVVTLQQNDNDNHHRDDDNDDKDSNNIESFTETSINIIEEEDDNVVVNGDDDDNNNNQVERKSEAITTTIEQQDVVKEEEVDTTTLPTTPETISSSTEYIDDSSRNKNNDIKAVDDQNHGSSSSVDDDAIGMNTTIMTDDASHLDDNEMVHKEEVIIKEEKNVVEENVEENVVNDDDEDEDFTPIVIHSNLNNNNEHEQEQRTTKTKKKTLRSWFSKKSKNGEN